MTLPEAPAAARFAIAFMTAIAIGTVVLVGPWVYFSNRLAPDFLVSPAGFGLMVVYFAPTVIALAMLVAVASVSRGGSRHRGRFALQATAVCAIGTFLVSGWLGPVASRELMRRSVEAHERHLDEAATAGRFTLDHTLRLLRPEPRGDRIARRLEGALRGPQMLPLTSLRKSAPPGYPLSWNLEWHRRLQAPVLVCVLGLLGWVLASTMTASAARIVMWWMLASLMAYASARLPADLRFSVLGVWLPVGVFAAAAIVLAAAGRAIGRSRAAPQVG